MGCFDFTYADTGENICGSGGYLYLTESFAKETLLPNPLPFKQADMYGHFTFQEPTIWSGDIYAIYSAVVFSYLSSQSQEDVIQRTFVESSFLFPEGFTLEKLEESVQEYIRLLRELSGFKNRHELVKLEDAIRTFGIGYFFDGFQPDSRRVTVKRMGLKKKRNLKANERFEYQIPLLITRHRLPAECGNDLLDAAARWGFCSASDPNQGYGTTKDYFCIFEPLEARDLQKLSV